MASLTSTPAKKAKLDESLQCVPTSLPSTIDQTVALDAFRSQHDTLLDLIRHCLPSLASSLYGESLIPEVIKEKACNQNLGSVERGMALLDSVRSKLMEEPSEFSKLIVILESDPYLKSQAEKLVKSYCACASSSAPSSNCPPVTSSAISHYHTYLKLMYNSTSISSDTKWPPPPGREFISLAVVQGRRCRDEYIGHTLQGNVEQVSQIRNEISIDQILDPVDKNKLRLVLMEGAPGIGKSTLAWELCRKWEELSCIRQYRLVVLLRLREQRVQNISDVSQLFISYEGKYKKPLVEEVSESQGNDVLFILDGYDELPKTLQQESFLLDLIKGCVLPASTVLVTSRPSATAELIISCQPQKHIEILGFTQESVEKYASSIFPSKKQLTKFMDYISVSGNPAINSLMYVPLNAAIIVQIYKSDDTLLSHTLTELYTLLCLTILNRDLNLKIEKFEDLPADLHGQFLHLSQIAFKAILDEKVILHTLPSDLVHFGFLDAVSALYGGGSVSYNFLHLTLQEFFAAYHISHLGSSGLEVFKQYGKDKRWNVVWRFVAGLTKFEHYKGHMDSDLFIKSRKDNEIEISIFTIQCLFEAHSVDHFSSIFRTPTTTVRYNTIRTALDAYALGFCISNLQTGVSWNIYINNHWTHFMYGLKRKTPAAGVDVGVIRQLTIYSSRINVCELTAHLSHLTSLSIDNCWLTNADLVHLSELIPNMRCLKKLDIQGNDITDNVGDQDGLLKTLQQLSYSKVTTLNIAVTGFCRILRDSPHDYSSTLKKLVSPSSGKLEELTVGDGADVDDDGRLASLVSAPSSLKSLGLHYTSLSGHVFYLKNNTCLTKLTLWYYDWSEQAPHIIQILKHNKTLLHLDLMRFSSIDDMKNIVNAISENNILQSITFELHFRTASNTAEYKKSLPAADPRIKILSK